MSPRAPIAKIIRPAPRDVRVTGAGRHRGLAAASLVRGNRLTQAVRERYAGWLGRWPRLHLALLRRVPPGINLSQQYFRIAVHLASHLTLAGLRRQPSAEKEEMVVQESGLPAVVARLERQLETREVRSPLALVTREAAPITEISQVLVGQGRIRAAAETGQTAGEAEVRQSPRAALNPVPRVVVRPGGPRPQAEEAGSPRADRAAQESAAAGVSAAVRSRIEPGMVDVNKLIDLNRVTEHVMQALERRLTAYRERLGRF
jgi:hypothetical protein